MDEIGDLTAEQATALSTKAGAVFRARSPISNKEFFAGRWEQITTVSDAVFQAGLHIVIFGERGVGKTSLANVVEPIVDVMEEHLYPDSKLPQRIAVKVNVHANDTFGGIWGRSFDEITWQADGPAVGFRPDISQETKTLRNAFGLTEHPTIDEVRKTLSYLKRSIFIFDEFDRTQPTERRMFTDLIKALSDYAIDSTVILVGVSDTIDNLVRDHGSISRSVVQIFLPRMTEDELWEILSKANAVLGVEISPEAGNLIVRMSQGLPHYTHLIGLHATREAANRRSNRIVTNDVTRSLSKAIKQALQTIREKYHTAIHSAHKGALYDKVILACATAASTARDELGFFHASDVLDPLVTILDRDNVTISTFQKHINEFVEDARGAILERTGAPRSYKYRFRDPLLPPYIFITAVPSSIVSQSRLAKLMTE